MSNEKRGTGRTTQGLQGALKVALEGPEPRLVFYVVHSPSFDDYCFRIVARLAQDLIKQYSMANRMILFKSGGRLRFITNTDDFLSSDVGGGNWRVAGYRLDTPIVWDHHAWSMVLEGAIARNKPHVGRPEKRR